MSDGPARRHLLLPAGYAEADLDLAEQIIKHFDLATLWVAWLIVGGPSVTPRLSDDG